MKVGIYANWRVYPVDNGFYIEEIHKKYLDQFHIKSKKLTLLCSSSKSKEIPTNFTFVPYEDVELVTLPYFSTYLEALKNSRFIWLGIKHLLSISDYIYLRTPEPFSWFAAILRKDQILNYHFTSNPMQVLKGRMKVNFLRNLFKIILFYPEYYLICISAYFNQCSANGNSVLDNVPFFLRKKIKVLVESSLLSSDDFSSPSLLPSCGFKFICVSRLQEGKGLELLINAFAQLKKEYQTEQFSLSLVGTGPAFESLVDLVKTKHLEKYVHFLGYVPNGDELNKVYKEHNFFINPSISETGPRTIIEALYNNLYCLSTDVGYVRDVIKGNPELGVIVKANDYSSLYDGIKSIVKKYDVSAINNINRRESCREYTLDNFVDKVLEHSK